MQPNQNNLIWIDLEMTGLDPSSDRILEIATVITDSELTVIAEGPVLAIYQCENVLSKMDAWCTSQHAASGLTARVRNSKLTAAKAEQLTLEFLEQCVPAGKSPMCGNTICQDRRFLYNYMPKLEKYFHYRNLDVTVLKLIAKSRYPALAKGYCKKPKHQALEDIYDSIDEMKYYLDSMLIKPEFVT